MKNKVHYLYFFVIGILFLTFIYLSLPKKNKSENKSENKNENPTEEEVTLEEITTEVVVDETMEDQNCHESCGKNLLFNLTLYVFAFAVLYKCILGSVVIKILATRDFMVNYNYSIEVILFAFPLVLSIFSLWKNSLCLIQIGIFIFYLVIFCLLLTSNYHLYKFEKKREQDEKNIQSSWTDPNLNYSDLQRDSSFAN